MNLFFSTVPVSLVVAICVFTSLREFFSMKVETVVIPMNLSIVIISSKFNMITNIAII